MKTTSTCVILGLTFFLFSCNSRVNKNELTFKRDDGQPLRNIDEGKVDGTVDGRAFYYFRTFTGVAYKKNKDGIIVLEESFKDGLKDGIYKNYYSNGNIQFEGFYKEGHYSNDGPIKLYYENGQLERVDNPDGTFYDYFETGHLRDEKVNKSHDRFIRKQFYENGQLYLEGTYKKIFDNDGMYKTNVADGIFKYYDKEGNLVRDMTLKDNILINTFEY